MIAAEIRIGRCAHALRTLRIMMRRLSGDTRGNVLMITGFMLLPLTFAMGMGVDYSRAMRVQNKLNGITDAAALATVTQPMMQQTLGTACDIARRTFTTQATGLDGLVLDTTVTARFSIVVTDTFASGSPITQTCPTTTLTTGPTALPLSRVTIVTYNGQSTNSFAKILKVDSLPVNGTSTAKASLAPFINVHVALDTSQSMGLPSTADGAKQLWQATGVANGRSCQFGCHVPGYVNGRRENYANEDIAAYLKIPLRVNVESQAVSDMISTAKTNQGNNSYYQFGLYQFGTSFSDIKALTTDLSSAQAIVGNLTLGPNDGTIGYGDTNLADVFYSARTRITVHGDGTTQSQARAFLFVITDGVQDLCGGSHCTAVLDPLLCDYYKNNNITVGIVYTTYLPVKANPLDDNDSSLRSEYTWFISPLTPDRIAPQLQACASPGWYFEASDGAGIHDAMQKLFAQATQTATITH